MSKLFYDDYIELEEIEVQIKNISTSPEEREELWNLIDELVHHRVLENILDNLPRDYHEDFLERFNKSPHSQDLLGYLNERIEGGIEEIIRKDMVNFQSEILEYFKA